MFDAFLKSAVKIITEKKAKRDPAAIISNNSATPFFALLKTVIILTPHKRSRHKE